MGAISGIVTPGNQSEAVTVGSDMLNKLQRYPFDRVGEETADGVHFGCGLVHITPEAQSEILPRYNDSQTLLITADAIIDNRAELFAIFNIEADSQAAITDSELIVLAYEKWGQESPKHLIGDYAYAIWDINKRELFCVRDPIGSRTLYYTYSNDNFAFCTVMKPLLGLFDRKPELNEKWIADFLAIGAILHETQCEETVYRDILQLPPAHYMTVASTGVVIKKYWDPLKDIAPIRFDTDEEYVEAFNRIFAEAVACRLRTAGEVGISLSGGMDSGSVACVAAPQLAKNGKKLYGLTSVPIQEFDVKPPKGIIYDERTEVELIARDYPNLESSLYSFEGKSSASDMDEVVDILEQPYKTFRNLTWSYSFVKEAKSIKCKVLLGAQMGNYTISYGSFKVHMLTLYRQGKLITVYREVQGLAKIMNRPVRKVIRRLLPVITPYPILKWRHRIKYKETDRFASTIVNRSLIAKWNVEERMDNIGKILSSHPFRDYEEEKEARANPVILSHVAALKTKLSLANGIINRDPSSDKRVIEFCLGIPSDQFVRNGNERYLLRRAMKGVLPDPIRTNTTARGTQSADWLHRLVPHWPELLAELNQSLSTGILEPYVDISKLRGIVDSFDSNPDSKNEKDVDLLLTAIVLSKFINRFNASFQ